MSCGATEECDGGHCAGTLSVTIVAGGNGAGTVTSSPAGINCPGTCSAIFASPSTVVLTAKTVNGSNIYFQGFGSAECAPGKRTCSISLSGDKSVTATFADMTYNLVFVSSATYPTTLGSAIAYDGKCNALASAAGINDLDAPNGTSFIAWMSDATSNARTRLGSARGFVRVDGLPFADDPGDFLGSSRLEVFNPIRFDEVGNNVGATHIMTGTGNGGQAEPTCTCSNWTSTSGDACLGRTSGGPIRWTSTGWGSCAPRRVYCIMTTRNVPVSPAPAAGKLIFTSNNYFIVGVGKTPDDVCREGTLPSGVASGDVVAFIATTTGAATSADKFTATAEQLYVRPDGQVVGTGAQIAAGGLLDSGIWQTADGRYGDLGMFTGAPSPNQAGTSADTCNDWTDSGGTTPSYGSSLADSWWWHWPSSRPCNSANLRLFCVER
jgi:hypothetical protein